MGLLDRIPLIGDLIDDTGSKVTGELEKNRQLWGDVKTPELSWKDINPEAYNSESANYALMNDDPTTRGRQESMLNQLSGLSSQGLSDADQYQFFKARQDANNLGKQREGAALQNAQARGLSGSGLEFAMREQGNQEAASRAQEAGLAQASAAANQRALYTQAYGNALSGVRNQNNDVASTNANIINQFNQANTQARNTANQYNVENRNNANVNNQTQRNATSQQNFNNQITKVGGQAEANSGIANAHAAQGAANQSTRNTLLNAGISAYTGMPAGAKKKPEEFA